MFQIYHLILTLTILSSVFLIAFTSLPEVRNVVSIPRTENITVESSTYDTQTLPTTTPKDSHEIQTEATTQADDTATDINMYCREREKEFEIMQNEACEICFDSNVKIDNTVKKISARLYEICIEMCPFFAIIVPPDPNKIQVRSHQNISKTYTSFIRPNPNISEFEVAENNSHVNNRSDFVNKRQDITELEQHQQSLHSDNSVDVTSSTSSFLESDPLFSTSGFDDSGHTDCKTKAIDKTILWQSLKQEACSILKVRKIILAQILRRSNATQDNKYTRKRLRKMTRYFCNVFDIHSSKSKIFPSITKKLPQLKTLLLKNLTHLMYFEFYFSGFFSIDFSLRLACTPSLKLFCMSPLNIIDFIALLAGYLRYVVYFLDISDIQANYEILLYIQIFRILRIFRPLQRLQSFRALIFTFNRRKYSLLSILLFSSIGLVCFSNLIYFFEHDSEFDSIPSAWWWCIVTMTTVGYGDMYPKTASGKVVGSLCAMYGIIVYSMTIPVFVNTFQNIRHLHDEDKRQTNNNKEDRVIEETRI